MGLGLGLGQIVIRTSIAASPARCFDLARDVAVHCQTAAFTGERVVPPGRTAGLLEPGDEVTFDARHFGLRWRLTARIVEFDRPLRFVDESLRGPFQSLRHTHEFHDHDGRTEMVDMLEWTLPFGVLGKLADTLFLRRHLLWFMTTKQRALKALAEE